MYIIAHLENLQPIVFLFYPLALILPLVGFFVVHTFQSNIGPLHLHLLRKEIQPIYSQNLLQHFIEHNFCVIQFDQ